jgi:hypothetical protein
MKVLSGNKQNDVSILAFEGLIQQTRELIDAVNELEREMGSFRYRLEKMQQAEEVLGRLRQSAGVRTAA